MPDLQFVQWAGAVVAALLVGLSKAGFGAGAGLLAVPLMAAVLGPDLMLGTMLLVLITGDVFSLVHHWRSHSTRNLLVLVPGLVIGIGLGYFALDWFRNLPDSKVWMCRLIGFLSVSFVVFQFLRMARERRLGQQGEPYAPPAWQGVSLGACAGLTSTLAHAGGPVVTLYLLPQKLDKGVFVGTIIKYFFIGNLIKLVPYIMQGVLDRQSIALSVALVPAVVVGTVLGVLLHRRFSDRGFRITVYCLAFCVGVSLMLSSAD